MEKLKFRKRPVEIEAVLFDGTPASSQYVIAWADKSYSATRGDGALLVAIETLEGTMYARPGDWIIKGVQGEFYPCKPDIFAATYEPAGGDV